MRRFLIAFFLLPCTIHAESQSISDFSGGMNTHDPSFRVVPGFSPYMRNVFVDDGKLNGINGYALLGSTNTLLKITGIFPFRKDTGQTTFVVTDSSVTLETSDFITYTFVSSGSNSGALLLWLQVRQKMWGYNGIDFVRTWDGTTLNILNGTKNLPNVPKFKVAAYYQERVFGFNNPSGASDLDWADVASTAGARLEPDDPIAWPATNNLKIGQGDGQLGTALWIQNGQLRMGKERSIYTLYGSNSSAYQVRKEENIGDGVASAESVVQQDGHTYWLGQYGIYEDGGRISDLIESDVNGITRNSVGSIENVWGSQSQFSKGQFYGSTATADGFLTQSISSSNVNISNNSQPSGQYIQISDTITMGGATGQTGYAVIVPTFTVPYSFLGYVRYVEFWIKVNDLGACTIGSSQGLRVSFYNSATKLNTGGSTFEFGSDDGQIGTTFRKVKFPVISGSRESLTFQNQPVSAGDVNAGSLSVNFSTSGGSASGCVYSIYPATETGNSTISLAPYSSVEFISEITTETSVTTWGNFESVNNTNGGTVSFYLRSSTSLVNIATQTWQTASPGSIISAPTQNRFIQWASTLTTPFPSDITEKFVNPNVDDVTIDHVEGIGSINRAFGLSWNNRYWLATSTTSSDTLSYILVKSKITNKLPNAFMPIEGIDIRSMAKNGNVLYGGSSSTGSVYRLDYGTSFNGTAIPFIYDTPDMTFGKNYETKNVKKYGVDAERSFGLTLNVGTSINMGALSNRTLSLDGSGRQMTIFKGVTNPAKTLRVRLSHSQLDKPFTVYDFTVDYDFTGIVENPQ